MCLKVVLILSFQPNLMLKSCCRSMKEGLSICCKCLLISYKHIQWEMSAIYAIEWCHTAAPLIAKCCSLISRFDHQARILPTYGCKSTMNGAVHVLLGFITLLYTYTVVKDQYKAKSDAYTNRKSRGGIFYSTCKHFWSLAGTISLVKSEIHTKLTWRSHQ